MGILSYQGNPLTGQSYTAAARWFQLAADQNFALAQHNLGVMYHAGEGFKQSDSEALRFFQLAADQGVALAQYNLGTMYEEGRAVPQSTTEAIKWYEKAAAQGQVDAVTRLRELKVQ